MAQQRRGVQLELVNTASCSGSKPDIDIIAIHGLDAKSPGTWTWKKDRKDTKDRGINWLSDPGMLPSKVGPARIFTCDWPADMFEPSDLARKTNEEFARRLLDGIKRRPIAANDDAREDRPILFIASCLGGVILMKALVMAKDEYDSIRRATRAIVFLATPFRGSSFQDVAAWAEPGLRAAASLRRRQVTGLVDSVKASVDLDELVRSFTQLCRDPAHPYQVMTFYELGKTNLYHKVIPGLPVGAKPLVDMSSATLQIVPNPLPLDRPHLLMNKFCGGSEDHDYASVTGKIEEFLHNMRKNEAYTWIHDKHYTAERLRVQRLSGDLLRMDQCYINLALVEQRGVKLNSSRMASGSPFSLLARQKVVTPDPTIQAELANIFDERKGLHGNALHPRRILIRGRAGVGKTTLCKKMVFDFTRDTQTKLYHSWTRLFDRLLWVPLRNLSGQSAQATNHEELFYYEYFCVQGCNDGRRLAAELWQTVRDTESRKTLFLLDGLDEVSQHMSGNSATSRLLRLLLNQPNVIITSRPNVSLPAGPDAVDIELETIGFYPHQVKDYLLADPQTKPRADEILSFLKGHWLMQSLVRIPIQLDALCYTWEDFNNRTVPSTMTGIYNAIEEKLWKKDIVRLDKMPEGFARLARPAEIEGLLETEIVLLERLAFSGLCNDVVDFSPQHRDKAAKMLPQMALPLDETLARISFLRAAGSSSVNGVESYHFIHLTFQEYFAARYFTRQWGIKAPLVCLFSKSDPLNDPVTFLRKQKYTARYDILWRFVAGLLDAIGDATGFLDIIEEEPLDLLGPMHQRLVMRCLSEISTDLPIRTSLERRISEWLLFECKSSLGPPPLGPGLGVMEVPDQSLDMALRAGFAKARILFSLKIRASFSPRLLAHVVSSLGDRHRDVRVAAVQVLGQQATLADETLRAMAALLVDDDSGVQCSAIRALGRQTVLPDENLQAVAARLGDDKCPVRVATIEVLGRKWIEMDKTLEAAVVARLGDDDATVRIAAIRALCRQSTLSDKTLQAVAARLGDDKYPVRAATIEALGRKWIEMDKTLEAAVAARLGDDKVPVRRAAIAALGRQSILADETLQAVAARLGDISESVQQAAVDALHRQPPIPQEIVEAIATRLGRDSHILRWALFNATGHQSPVAVEALQSAAVQVGGSSHIIRWAAAEVLRSQPALDDDILQSLVAWLGDNNEDIRWAAVEVLCSQLALDDDILQALVAWLGDKNEDIRWAAVEVLRSQPALNGDILQAVVAWLGDKNARSAAGNILRSQSPLPNKTMQPLAAHLGNKDESAERLAINILGQQSTLTDEILQLIVARLGSNDHIVQSVAIQALQDLSPLPDDTLQAIAAHLRDSNFEVRRSAIDVLSYQSILPDDILRALEPLLEDDDISIIAEKILRRHAKFYCTALGGPYAKSLYKSLFERSYMEDLSLYIDDDDLYVNTPENIMKTSIHPRQNDIRAMINKARSIGSPLIGRA